MSGHIVYQLNKNPVVSALEFSTNKIDVHSGLSYFTKSTAILETFLEEKE